MQKILSARLEEAALDEMERAVRKLRITKKRFLEEAIHAHAARTRTAVDVDCWSETLGAWKRPEGPARTVRAVRLAFQRAMERHHVGEDARLHR